MKIYIVFALGYDKPLCSCCEGTEYKRVLGVTLDKQLVSEIQTFKRDYETMDVEEHELADRAHLDMLHEAKKLADSYRIKGTQGDLKP